MANHDFVFVYGNELRTWLHDEGCDAPAVREGNRYPTKDELLATIAAEDLLAQVKDDDIFVLPPPTAPAAVHAATRQLSFCDFGSGTTARSANRSAVHYLVEVCASWDKLNVDKHASITMRGSFSLELFLLRRLAETCGQLLLYPDTGDPPAVVEPGCNIGEIARHWMEVVEGKETWGSFFRRVASIGE